jgi:redox-sensitive bicupin YhaK (pirin superfamily)
MSMPVARVDGFRATVLAGSAFDLRSPVMLFSELIGVDFVADAATHTRIELQRHHEHAVLCLRGVARIDGQAIEPAALHYAPPGRDRVELACDGAVQLLLIGGTPFDEALLIWWNFVARTQAEIEVAAADWNAAPPLRSDVRGQRARVPAPSTAAGLRLKAR